MMTVERAAKRYLQIAALQRQIDLTDEKIAEVKKEISAATDRLTELKDAKNAMQADIRSASRDVGDLPLIDLMDELGTTHVLEMAEAQH